MAASPTRQRLTSRAKSTRRSSSAPVETLAEGANSIIFTAIDFAGNTTSASRLVTLDTHAPVPANVGLISVSALDAGPVAVAGEAGCAEPGAQVTVTIFAPASR